MGTPNASDGNACLLKKWIGPALIVAAALAQTAWGWRKWPDVLVDYGQTPYIAWQLAAGKTLYTDIAYFQGPLSPYVNSVLFRLFGVSLTALMVGNLVFIAGILFLLHQLLAAISDRLTAAAGCLTFVGVFGFAQYVPYGNYNFVCPYTPELTHGVALSLLGIWFLSRYARRHRPGAIAGAGISTGLVFLTRVELFLPAFLAITAGLGLVLCSEKTTPARRLRAMGLFLGCVCVPPLAAIALLSLKMSAHQALASAWMLPAWSAALAGRTGSLKFYRDKLGITDVPGNLREILAWLGWYAALFVPAALAAVAVPRPAKRHGPAALAVFVIVAGLLLARLSTTQWLYAARPLPVLMLALGALTGVEWFRCEKNDPRRGPLIVRLVLIIYSVAMLARIILNVHVYHYGFALAMPAGLLLVAALCGWVPAAIDRRGREGGMFRAAAFAALAVGIFAHLQVQESCFSQKSFTVGSGGDRILADFRGPFVARALRAVAVNIRTNETLTVLPDGQMLNYLSRRASPVPYTDFMPTEFAIFGEDAILDSFRVDPPDYIALVHKDTSEFGYRFFGRDYGRKVYAWIEENYQPAALIGDMPLQDDRFGILFLKRRTAGSGTRP